MGHKTHCNALKALSFKVISKSLIFYLGSNSLTFCTLCYNFVSFLNILDHLLYQLLNHLLDLTLYQLLNHLLDLTLYQLLDYLLYQLLNLILDHLLYQLLDLILNFFVSTFGPYLNQLLCKLSDFFWHQFQTFFGSTFG